MKRKIIGIVLMSIMMVGCVSGKNPSDAPQPDVDINVEKPTVSEDEPCGIPDGNNETNSENEVTAPEDIIEGDKTELPEDNSETIKDVPVEEKETDVKTPEVPTATLYSIGNMTGKTITEAKTKLTNFKLQVSEEYHESIKSGVVISQNPNNGEKAKDTIIKIVVSKGKKPVAVAPTPTPAPKPTAPAPAPAPTPAPTPTPAPAPQPTLITMPDFMGMTFAQAEAKTKELGIKLIKKELYHATSPKGTVIQQDTHAGTVANASGITLTFSLGSVPTVSGTSLPTVYAYKFLGTEEQKLLSIINKERANKGLPALIINNSLQESARYKANAMLQYDYLSKNNPQTPQNLGYEAMMKNMFNVPYSNVNTHIHGLSGTYGSSFTQAEGFIEQIKNSGPATSLILSSAYTHVGIGIVYSDSAGNMWNNNNVQLLAIHFGGN